MNKNIIIIAVAAIAAFMAVLLIPRLLERDVVAEPREEAESTSTAETGSAGSRESSDDQQQAAAPAQSGGTNTILEAQLAEAVRQVNAGGPIVIDEMTTMTAARSQGTRIQYRYEISRELNAAQVRQFQNIATNQNQRAICTRPETRQLIDLGGEIEYVYYGPGNRFLFSTPIVGC